MKLTKKITLKSLGKLLLYFLAFFALYLFAVSTITYALPKKVSDENKESLTSIWQREEKDNPGPDRVVLVETPEDALNVRLELLSTSQQSIDIAYHAIHRGDSTDAVLAELCKAADRGVTVRILLDGKAGSMSRDISGKLKALSAHPNIFFRQYVPLNLLKPWEFHSLLHDKFIIVDNEFLLLGGRNLGDRYYDPESYTQKITDDRDVLVWNTGTLEESVLSQINGYMTLLWDSPDTKEVTPKEDKELTAQLLAMVPSFQQENPKFYERTLEDYKQSTVETREIALSYNPINNTKKEPWVGYQLRALGEASTENVLIQTPYSTANKHLLAALEDTSQRIPVQMLTNSMASSPNLPAFSNYYHQRQKFVDTGVQIFEYQSLDSIHGKSMVFDDRISAVGSYNLDDRSMYLDTETMLLIDSPEFAEQLTQAIEDFIATSAEVGKDNKYIPTDSVEILPVPLPKRILMWLVSIISRLFQFLI